MSDEKTLREKRQIVTSSGRVVTLTDPKPDDIDLGDIAEALSKLCRYGGNLRRFYSVAQHSVLCSQYVEGGPHLQRAALLHDAAEAYVGDLIWPLKALLRDKSEFSTSDFDDIEERFALVIEERFGLTAGLLEHPAVKIADQRVGAAEQLLLRSASLYVANPEWKPEVEPAFNAPPPGGWQSHEDAYIDFLNRARELVIA